MLETGTLRAPTTAMPLGYCMACGRLTSIRKGAQQWGSRQVDWFPVTHSKPSTHRGCGEEVVEADRDTGEDFKCLGCGSLVQEADIEDGQPCASGHARAIR